KQKGRTTHKIYDNKGRLEKNINPDNSTETIYYQKGSNRKIASLHQNILTKYIYNNQGQMIKVAKVPSPDLKKSTSQKERIELFDKNTVSKISYDDFGYKSKMMTLTANTTMQNPQWRLAAKFNYSINGKLENSLTPLSTSGATLRTFQHDAVSNGTQKTTVYEQFLEHPDFHKNKYNTNLTGIQKTEKQLLKTQFYRNNKLIKSIDQLGNTTEFFYTAGGMLLRTETNGKTQTRQFYNDKGQLTASRDAIGRITKKEYDQFGNLSKIIRPDGSEIKYNYSKYGRLLSKTGASQYPIGFEYSPFGEMVSYTDGNGSETFFEYDTAGKLIKRTWANGSTVTYSYNRIGQLKTKDENNRLTNYSYDKRNRLTNVSISDIDGAYTRKTEYMNSFSGLPSSITDDNSQIKYKYDRFGRLLLEKGPIGTITYQYSPRGKIKTKTCSFTSNPGEKFTTAYFYDAHSRIIGIKSHAGRFKYTRNKKGQIISLESDDMKIISKYDEIGRLQKKILKTKKSTKLLASYKYDKLNRRIAAKVNDTLWQYKYDPFDQLIAAQGKAKDGEIFNFNYQFDPIGNRLKDKQNSYCYNQLNQLAEAENRKSKQKTQYKYDDFGNLTSSVGIPACDQSTVGIPACDKKVYTYNLRNRLIKVESPENTTTYKYDPLGQRIKSVSISAISGQTKTTTYLMSGMIEQARTVSSSATSMDNYTFHTLGLDMAGTLTSTGGVGAVLASSSVHKRYREDLPLKFQSYQYLYDGNGNVIATCNRIGEYSSQFTYAPFGKIIKSTGRNKNKTCFNFSTKPVDDTGLVYYGYRSYDPELGRWLNRDPIGEFGGLNVYGFVVNHPTSRCDILGLETAKCTKFIGSAPTRTYLGAMPYGSVGGGSSGSSSSDQAILVYRCEQIIQYNCECCEGSFEFYTEIVTNESVTVSPGDGFGDFFWDGIPGTWPPAGSGAGLIDIILTWIINNGMPSWGTPDTATYLGGIAPSSALTGNCVGTTVSEEPDPNNVNCDSYF
ncbi:MAG: RHS repeat-associated core domain-containing protein, partial [Verrucomicrobiota bacterium]|nr:RHS repeat-associated core domain-containing protein [Verrucomicrobiota bacterium]